MQSFSLEFSILTIAYLTLGYVFGGYGLSLLLVRYFRHAPQCGATVGGARQYSVAVLVAMHNEHQHVESKIENLLAQDYPQSNLTIMIVCDHCTDQTSHLARQFAERFGNVVVHESSAEPGKSNAQNWALDRIACDIVVFSDAETMFAGDTVSRLVEPFACSSVGAVDGHLTFAARSGAVGGQGLYWRYEQLLRQLESQIGILGVTSGACMAVRRNYLRSLHPDVGEDCTVPLDILDQGLRVVHAESALAIDKPNSDSRSEWRARVRMTSRNWKGTWRYARLLNPFRNPGVSWALWSHKLLRWMTPVFLIAGLGAAFKLSLNGYLLPGLPLEGLAALGLVGALAAWFRLDWPMLRQAYGFLLVEAAFLVGILHAYLGPQILRYRDK